MREGEKPALWVRTPYAHEGGGGSEGGKCSLASGSEVALLQRFSIAMEFSLVPITPDHKTVPAFMCACACHESKTASCAKQLAVFDF